MPTLICLWVLELSRSVALILYFSSLLTVPNVSNVILSTEIFPPPTLWKLKHSKDYFQSLSLPYHFTCHLLYFSDIWLHKRKHFVIYLLQWWAETIHQRYLHFNLHNMMLSPMKIDYRDRNLRKEQILFFFLSSFPSFLPFFS